MGYISREPPDSSSPPVKFYKARFYVIETGRRRSILSLLTPGNGHAILNPHGQLFLVRQVCRSKLIDQWFINRRTGSHLSRCLTAASSDWAFTSMTSCSLHQVAGRGCECKTGSGPNIPLERCLQPSYYITPHAANKIGTYSRKHATPTRSPVRITSIVRCYRNKDTNDKDVHLVAYVIASYLI